MGLLDVVGGLLGTDNKSAVNKANETLDNIATMAAATRNANQATLDQYLAQMQNQFSGGARAYDDAVANLANAIGNADYSGFQYGGNVNSFYDPAAQQRANAAMDAIENSAASGGSRFSSNFLDKVAAKQQALASEEWSKAYDRMMQDRAAQLQQWQTGNTQQQNRLQNIATLANVYGMDRNALNDAVNSYYTNTINNRNANLQTVADLTAGKAQNELARTNGISDIFGGAATLGAAILK